MLMCRNVAAGIGSNEQGSIVERLCSDLDRKEPRYKCTTLPLCRTSGISSILNRWLKTACYGARTKSGQSCDGSSAGNKWQR